MSRRSAEPDTVLPLEPPTLVSTDPAAAMEAASNKLTIVVWLLVANLFAMGGAAAGLLFGLLPQVERAVEVSERVESRFEGFANSVEPALTTGRDVTEAIGALDDEFIERLNATLEKAGNVGEIDVENMADRFADRLFEKTKRTNAELDPVQTERVAERFADELDAGAEEVQRLLDRVRDR